MQNDFEQAQAVGLKEQLDCGARSFDLRLVKTGGERHGCADALGAKGLCSRLRFLGLGFWRFRVSVFLFGVQVSCV